MNNKTKDQETFFKTMINFVINYTNKLRFNRGVYGVITLVKGNGLYEVEIDGSKSDLYALLDKTYLLNDIVIILIINNNFDTGKYILSKRP